METIFKLQFSFFKETICLAKGLSIWHGMTLLDNIKQIRYLKFRTFLVRFIHILIIHIAHWHICAAVKFVRDKYRRSHLEVLGNTCFPYFRSSRPDVFCKKGIVKNFAKLTGKQLCQSLFFNKIWNVFFPVNFAKFLGAPVFIKRLWWLFVLFEETDLVSKVGGRYVVH